MKNGVSKYFKRLSSSEFSKEERAALNAEVDKELSKLMVTFEKINFNRKTIDRIVIKLKTW